MPAVIAHLEIPLTQAQLDEACHIHEKLPQWQVAERALKTLAVCVPGFSKEACLLKTVAVNSIYGTQLLAFVRMAQHIEKVLANKRVKAADVSIVEQIAALPAESNGKTRRATSFASKFCHFFLDAEKFPIYDEAARDTIAMHLGRENCRADKAKPYLAFCENFKHLRVTAGVKCTTKQLDSYLWLVGMYLRWRKEEAKAFQRVNAELRQMFLKPTKSFADAFAKMLPAELAKGYHPEL